MDILFAAMERFTVLSLCLFCLALSSQSHSATSKDGWKLVSDRNDIQVYMKHRDDSRLKTFRGVTRFTLKDEYALAAVLNDYPSYPNWLHFVDGAEEFHRQSPMDRWLRFTTQLPWPLADREAILEASVRVHDEGTDHQQVMIDLANQPDRLPPNNNYIRFPEMHGKLGFQRINQAEKEDQVEVVYELILDPGGFIPAWLANILLRDAPYFTLERLRRIIHKSQYQNHYYDYLPTLRGPGKPAAAPPEIKETSPEAM